MLLGMPIKASVLNLRRLWGWICRKAIKEPADLWT
jgi:hypothetical protein